MDLVPQTNPIVTDFTTQPNTTNFGTENAGSVYNVKLANTFNLDDSAEQGDVVLTIPLDNTMTTELTALANAHERYGINDLEVDIQSVAPFGTSSGAVQVLVIPDPTNAAFGADKAENLAKAVRQSGSLVVRPRDSKVLRVKTEGTCYCKASGDPRFYSFGCIAVVVREPPATGDYMKATTTLTGTYQYYKTTINSNTTLVRDKLAVRMSRCSSEGISFKIPDFYLPNKISLKTYGNFPFAITKLEAGSPFTRLVKPMAINLRRKDVQTFIAYKDDNPFLNKITGINTPVLNEPKFAEVTYFI